MKKLFYLLLITFSCGSFGQNLTDNYEIGCFIDYNKQLINGYSDFDYEPEKSLNVSYVIEDNFTEGYYYDKSGLKISGLLKYSQKDRDLKFKLINEDKEKSIKADESKGYVIGVDTFSVVKNVDIIGVFGSRPSEKDEFAEVIEKVNGMSFYKFSALAANGSYCKYVVQKAEGSEFLTFPAINGKFQKMAMEIFGSDEVLKAEIEMGKYKEKDIASLIKYFKYRKLYENNQNIYYNSSWDETNNSKESSYYAKIESIQNSVFHLGYFLKNGVKIYEGDFTSFYPHKKKGVFTFYYPNGKIRKQVKYEDNKPRSAIEYFLNGEIHRQTYYPYEDGFVYKQVNNDKGLRVLGDDMRAGKELFIDKITGKEITYEYKDQVLINAYYTNINGEKVYQLCDKNAKLDDFKKFQKLINDKLKYPLGTIQKFNHGYALIKCIVEPTGLVSEVKLIKGIDSDCDVAIMSFFECFKNQAYWKPGKVDGVNVKQEIILPIDFSITGFSTYKNHYNNFWMMNHMMMQQQMMMQQNIMRAPVGRF